MPEQRRHTRRALAVQFQGSEAEGAGQLVFTSADLSAGGAFLASELLLEESEQVSLAFHLPGDAQPLRAQARVAWVRRFPEAVDPPGMGVEFVTMERDDRQRLQAFLSDGD